LLYLKRVMFWLGWLLLTGVFVFVCILLLDVSEAAQQDEDCVFNATSVDDIDFTTAVNTAECNLRLYSTTIAITFANLLIPTIFSFIVTLEEYSPKSQLIVDLTRNIIFRLAGLVVVMITLINTNNCEYYESDGLSACDNFNQPEAACNRTICWETSIGKEFYRLTVFDLIIQVLVVICVDTLRVKCFKSKIEFNISKHVLDIVYSQSICWLGLFFAPLLSAITLLKLILIFYLRIIYLKYLCKPSNSRYEASRTSSLLNYFLLFSFLVSVGFLAFIVGEMFPSNACGPFRDTDARYYTGVVANMINEWSWTFGRDFLQFLGRSVVLMGLSSVILLMTYLHLYLNYSVLHEYNIRIRKQLRSVVDETKHLKLKLEDYKLQIRPDM